MMRIFLFYKITLAKLTVLANYHIFRIDTCTFFVIVKDKRSLISFITYTVKQYLSTRRSKIIKNYIIMSSKLLLVIPLMIGYGLASDDDSYEVDSLVSNLHNIPHLDKNLDDVDNKFNISTNFEYNDYVESLVVVPSIIALCVFFLLFGFVIILISRCCFDCSKCRRTVYDNDVRKSKKRMWLILSILAIVLAIFSDSTVIVGNVFITNGVNQGLNSLDSLQDTFVTLNNDGDTLVTETTYLQSNLELAIANDCTEAVYMQQYITDIDNAINQYFGYVEDIPNKFDNVHEFIVKYVISIKNRVIWTFFCFILLFLVLFISGIVCNNATQIKVGMVSSYLTMSVLLLLCTVSMIILVCLFVVMSNSVRHVLLDMS